VVYWLARPPYLRWAAASLLVVVAAAMELQTPETVLQPFARIDIAAGSEITEDQVAWRAVPPGIIPPVEVEGWAAVAISAGTPLMPALVAAAPQLPSDWWALELALPATAVTGASLRLILTAVDGSGTVTVPGLLISAVATDGLGEQVGLVAVPEEFAAAAAAAASGDRVVVLVGGGG
jgi:hypothetical protein